MRREIGAHWKRRDTAFEYGVIGFVLALAFFGALVLVVMLETRVSFADACLVVGIMSALVFGAVGLLWMVLFPSR